MGSGVGRDGEGWEGMEMGGRGDRRRGRMSGEG